MRCIMFSALSLVLLPAVASGQTVFDDFLGNKLNEQVWTTWGDQNNVTISNSLYQIKLPQGVDVGATSMGVWRRDFDFILDFKNFNAVGNAQSFAALSLFVIGGQGLLHKRDEVEIGISGNSTARRFFYESEKGGSKSGAGFKSTSATAGELRIKRVWSQKQLFAMYRPSNQLAWTTIKTWTDWMPELVLLEFEGQAPGGMTLSVSSDKMKALGQPLTPVANYGQGCHSIKSRPFGIAYLGNPSFGLFVEDSSRKHKSQPVLMLLGFTKLALDMSSFGAKGCNLYASPDLSFFIGLTGNEEASAIGYLPIPNIPGLVGLKLYFQHLVGTKQNGLGFAFSNGVEARIVKL